MSVHSSLFPALIQLDFQTSLINFKTFSAHPYSYSLFLEHFHCYNLHVLWDDTNDIITALMNLQWAF